MYTSTKVYTGTSVAVTAATQPSFFGGGEAPSTILMLWDVPQTGVYQVTLVGGDGASSSSAAGGLGASVTVDMSLTQGEVLSFGGGSKGTYTGEGGAGSYLTFYGFGTEYENPDFAPQVLLVAGGGGGGSADGIAGENGSNADLTGGNSSGVGGAAYPTTGGKLLSGGGGGGSLSVAGGDGEEVAFVETSTDPNYTPGSYIQFYDPPPNVTVGLPDFGGVGGTAPAEGGGGTDGGGGGGGGYDGGNGGNAGLAAEGGTSFWLASQEDAETDYYGGGGATVYDNISQQYYPLETSAPVITGTNAAHGQDGSIAISLVSPPSLAGLMTSQIDDNATVDPFSSLIISDATPVPADPTETVTITQIGGAVNGFLTDPYGYTDGATNSGGVFSVTGQLDDLNNIVNALIFNPVENEVGPGQSVTTTFQIQVTDQAGLSVTDSTTQVTVTNNAPIIGGTTPSTATTDEASVNPFQSVTITDPTSPGAELTLTITYDAANGTLVDPSIVDRGASAAGSFTISTDELLLPSIPALQTALDGLEFIPTAHQVTPGDSITTTFTIAVSDGIKTTTDDTTTVTATAVDDPPVIIGAKPETYVADDVGERPFADVTVTDPDSSENGSGFYNAMIQLSGPGGTSDADGLLSYNGYVGNYIDLQGAPVYDTLYEVIPGQYLLAAQTPADLSEDLDYLSFQPTLHQVAAGEDVTTNFSLTVTQFVGLDYVSTTDNTTNVTAISTAANNPPAIGGTPVSAAAAGAKSFDPFSTVTISDPDSGQTETVTVTYAATSGTLADPNAGTDSSSTAAGSYKVSGGVGQVQADLQALVFTPKQSVTPEFTLAVSDGFATVQRIFGSSAQVNGGAVTGWLAGDTIDLTDMGGSGPALLTGIATSSASTTLTISDGAHSTKVTLDGSFEAGSFALASDGATGTLISFDPNTPYDMTLPAAAVGLVLGSLSNTVSTTAANLLAGDSIDGGVGGSNSLILTGAGSFNLAAPAKLRDFSTIDVQEGAGANLTLRGGLNATVDVSGSAGISITGAANSDVIDLGSGNDTVTLGYGETVNGGDGNDTITVTAPTETVNAGSGTNTITVTSYSAGATINGGIGDNTLVVSGGNTVVMGGNITGISSVELLSPTKLTLNSIPDLRVFGASAQLTGSTITGFLTGDTIDLTDMGIGGTALLTGIATAAASTTLTITDGTNTAKITLNGSFAAGSFALASDGATGTTLGFDPNTAYEETLPAQAVALVLGSLSNTVTTTAANLLAADSIDGGVGGSNSLILSGEGSFNLAAAAKVKDFSTIEVQEGAGNSLTLRGGLNAAVDVTGTAGISITGASNTDVINLGSGNDTVTLGYGETVNGGGGNNTITVAAPVGTVNVLSGDNTIDVTSYSIGATINGGSGVNTLVVSGGNTAVMGSNITGISSVELLSPTKLTMNSIAGLRVFGATAQLSGSTITGLLGGDTIDLTDMGGTEPALLRSITTTAASSTLTIIDGSHTAVITLDGSFAAGSFALAGDGATGTTLSFDPNTPYEETLPAQAVALVLGSLSNTVTTTATDLLPTDSIDGGVGGSNSLILSGGGSFNLAALATLKDFSTIEVQEGAGTSLTLRAALNATVDVSGSAGISITGAANTDAIDLGSGNDTVSLGYGETVNGGGGNNAITVLAPTATVNGGSGNNTITVTSYSIGATINAGSGVNTLVVSGGNTAVMGSNITGISRVELLNPTKLTLNSTPDLRVFGTSAQVNASTITGLQTGDTIDLTDMGSGGPALLTGIATAAASTTLTITDGTNTAKVTLNGSFAAGSFALASDGATGTTLSFDPNTPYEETLPAQAVALVLGSLSNTVTTTATDLLAADSIDGGVGGSNSLILSGGGSFNLAALAVLKDFATITVEEGAGTSLTLRSALNATVNVTGSAGITITGASNSDVIDLGSGNDTVTLGYGETVNGGGGNNSITVLAPTATVNGGSGNNTITVTSYSIGATINAGSGVNTLVVSGGNTAVMGSNITGISAVQLTQATTFQANATADLQITGSSGGGDTITIGAPNQSVIAGGPDEHIRATAANAGAAVSGLGADSELEITTGGTVTLNADTGGSAAAPLLVKLDAATNLTLSGMQFITAQGSGSADTITAGAANQTLTGGGATDTLVGYSGGGDLFSDTSVGLNGDTIQNFLSSDQIDVTDLAPGSATLTAAASGSNTLIQVKSGTTKTSFLMTGSFNQGGFMLNPDAGHGTVITYS